MLFLRILNKQMSIDHSICLDVLVLRTVTLPTYSYAVKYFADSVLFESVFEVMPAMCTGYTCKRKQ